jgi:preprotein translocase SecE subunit
MAKHHFIGESYAELRKVEWPNRRQLVSGSVAVVIACAIAGAYLYGLDLVFRNLVDRVLL